MEFLKCLVEDYGCGDENAVLSDRSFLVKAIRVIKASAILRGGDDCEFDDLRALSYLTTFRVPSEVHEEVPFILEQLINEAKSHQVEQGREEERPQDQDQDQDQDQEEISMSPGGEMEMATEGLEGEEADESSGEANSDETPRY